MTGYDEALDWFRADPERMQDLDDVDNRSAAIAIVNAVLAEAVPAGRDLTAQDELRRMSGWFGGAARKLLLDRADELDRIARPSGSTVCTYCWFRNCDRCTGWAGDNGMHGTEVCPCKHNDLEDAQ